MPFAAIDAPGWALIIAAVFSGIVSVLGAFAALYAAINAGRAKAASAENAVRLTDVKADVRKIEVATNSMKDALVNKTAEAATAIGEAKGRADQKAEMKQDATDAAAVAAPGPLTDAKEIKADVKIVKADVKEIKDRDT